MKRVFVVACLVAFAAGCGKRNRDRDDDDAASPSVQSTKRDAPPGDTPKKDAPKSEKSEVPIEAIGTVGVGEWSQVGEVRIGIYAVTIGKPLVISDTRDSESEWDETFLQVAFNIENLSKTKKLEYHTPGSAGFGESAAKLVDEHGNDYRYRAFNSSFHLKGAPRYGKSLYPGDKAITDVLCFQVPVDAAKTLRLSLSCPIGGEKRRHEFRIPAVAWQKK